MGDDTGTVIPIRGRVIPPQPREPAAKPEPRTRNDPIIGPTGPKARAAAAQRAERDRRIMQMWNSGSSAAAIATALSARGETVSVPAIKKVIGREQRRAAEDRKELADVALEMELARIDGLIRRAHTILDTPCSACEGSGTTPSGNACRECRGDGRASHPDTRLRAMREIRACTESRVKILGLDAPSRHEHTGAGGGPIAMELAQMSDDELDRSLDDFQSGVAAARALAPDAPIE